MDLNHTAGPGRPNPDQSPSPVDLPDPWGGSGAADPVDERARARGKLRRFRLGFSALGLALAIAGLMAVGLLLLLFSGQGRLPIFADFIRLADATEAAIVWTSLFGVCLLWGSWPDRDWQRRSGLLLLMCLVDALLWSLDHAAELGLSDAKIGHDWFRHSLGAAIGWSEIALIASLSADLAAHLGQPRAIDLGRATRSLATTGAMIWGLYFYSKTNWRGPVWPLRQVQGNLGSFLLRHGVLVINAINLVQVTALSLLASRSCGQALREQAAEDQARESWVSPSERGWEEFTGPGAKKGS